MDSQVAPAPKQPAYPEPSGAPHRDPVLDVKMPWSHILLVCEMLQDVALPMRTTGPVLGNLQSQINIYLAECEKTEKESADVAQ